MPGSIVELRRRTSRLRSRDVEVDRGVGDRRCAHEPVGEDRVRPAPGPRPIEDKQPPVKLSATAAELAKVTRFALGGVGVAGTTSEGEVLARKLAKEPDAIAQFTVLAQHDNRVARLYAYWALRTLDPARAASQAPTLLSDPTKVEAMGGCMMFEDETKQLAAQIEKHPRPL